VTGVHVVDIEGKLHKYRLDETGKEIEMMVHIDEEGHVDKDAAKKSVKNETEETVKMMAKLDKLYEDSKKALKENEGCKLSGFVFINKVPGNFHISGHHYPEVVQKLYMTGHTLDFSHKINHLSFGSI
jgi:CTP-dependent riboflavin kinase